MIPLCAKRPPPALMPVRWLSVASRSRTTTWTVSPRVGFKPALERMPLTVGGRIVVEPHRPDDGGVEDGFRQWCVGRRGRSPHRRALRQQPARWAKR